MKGKETIKLSNKGGCMYLNLNTKTVMLFRFCVGCRVGGSAGGKVLGSARIQTNIDEGHGTQMNICW